MNQGVPVVESWKDDNCADVKARYALYSVAHAAALWCGVSEDLIEQVLEEASPISESGLGRCIFSHPNAPCLKPRCLAIAEAIESGVLSHSRENGKLIESGEHAAYERWHVSGLNLKKWIEEEFPNEKPAFLFDDIERNSHTAISTESYRALTAERDTLKSRVNKAIGEFKTLRQEKELLEAERDALKVIVEKFTPPTETTDNPSLSNSLYWNNLNKLIRIAVNEYPNWKKTQKRIQKTGNLQDWLTSTVKVDNREAEIIKKILSDFFQELR